MELKKNTRFCGFVALQNVFFFEVSIGIMANAVLLLFHVLTFLLERRPKPTDLIISYLALIHIVMLLTMGFIGIDIAGFQGLWSNITCKFVIYLYRLMRGLSICTTCLLSVLQAITLSPRSSCLAKFKQKSLHHSLCGFLFFWVLNLITNGRILISAVATWNVTSSGGLLLTTSCSLLPISSLLKYMFFSLMTFQHILFIGLMVISSGYMVILLCRHKRQSQHLHSTNLSLRASPEQRATRTILLLTSFFFVMYSLDFVLGSVSSVQRGADPVLHCVLILVGHVYAIVSPLVLISSERRMIRCFTLM